MTLTRAGRARGTLSRSLLSLGFVTAGFLHFVKPDGYVDMVPDYLPAHLALVLVSGAAEIAGGIALLVPKYRALAGKGLILLLVAVFPANLDMALHAERHSIPPALLWARLPLQAVLIWWVHWASRPDRPILASSRNQPA